MLNSLMVGAATLPAFPTVDISSAADWAITGITGIFSSNATILVTAIVAITLLPKSLGWVKKFINKIG